MHGMLGLIPGFVLLMIMVLSSCSQPAPPAIDVGRDLVWRNGTMTLRLTDMPCGFKELDEELSEAGIPPARASAVLQEGRPVVPGCWAATFGDEVLLRDVAGGDSFMPLSWFTRTTQD